MIPERSNNTAETRPRRVDPKKVEQHREPYKEVSDGLERQAIIQDVVERKASAKGKRWERLTVEEAIGPTVPPSVFEFTTHGFTQRLI